jgi:hypothetical protein
LTLTSLHSHRCDDPNYVSAQAKTSNPLPNLQTQPFQQLALLQALTSLLQHIDSRSSPSLCCLSSRKLHHLKPALPGQLDSDCLTFAAQAISTSPASGGSAFATFTTAPPHRCHILPLILPCNLPALHSSCCSQFFKGFKK